MALLVMDVQSITIDLLKEHSRDFLGALAETIAAARNKKIPVIYTVVGFRKGYPELSDNNKAFSASRKRGRIFDSEESMKIPPQVAPQSDEVVVIKKRVSAFTGSDLEVILRSSCIQQMVLTGIATGGVILSTLPEAADKDYTITVLSDCCADMDSEVHQVLTTKIFPRQADVITHQEWIEKLG